MVELDMFGVPKTGAKPYTYAEYTKWESNKHFELINGELLAFGSHCVRHQQVVMNLAMQFMVFFGSHSRKIYPPIDVILDTREELVVQPDLSVILDEAELANGKNCVGAPDMVIEIISPSNRKHDCVTKREIYEKHGVREYWIIDPDAFAVYVHTLENSVFKNEAFLYPSVLPVGVIDGLSIDFSTIFEEENDL